MTVLNNTLLKPFWFSPSFSLPNHLENRIKDTYAKQITIYCKIIKKIYKHLQLSEKIYTFAVESTLPITYASRPLT